MASEVGRYPREFVSYSEKRGSKLADNSRAEKRIPGFSNSDLDKSSFAEFC